MGFCLIGLFAWLHHFVWRFCCCLVCCCFVLFFGLRPIRVRWTALTRHSVFKHEQGTSLGLKIRDTNNNNNNNTVIIMPVPSQKDHNFRSSYHHYFIHGPDVPSFKYEGFFPYQNKRAIVWVSSQKSTKLIRAAALSNIKSEEIHLNVSKVANVSTGRISSEDSLPTVMAHPGHPVQSHP